MVEKIETRKAVKILYDNFPHLTIEEVLSLLENTTGYLNKIYLREKRKIEANLKLKLEEEYNAMTVKKLLNSFDEEIT